MLKALRYCNIFIIKTVTFIVKCFLKIWILCLVLQTVHFPFHSHDSRTSHRKNSLILQGNQKYTYGSGIIHKVLLPKGGPGDYPQCQMLVYIYPHVTHTYTSKHTSTNMYVTCNFVCKHSIHSIPSRAYIWNEKGKFRITLPLLFIINLKNKKYYKSANLQERKCQ